MSSSSWSTVPMGACRYGDCEFKRMKLSTMLTKEDLEMIIARPSENLGEVALKISLRLSPYCSDKMRSTAEVI
jgi:hypothetical protein